MSVLYSARAIRFGICFKMTTIDWHIVVSIHLYIINYFAIAGQAEIVMKRLDCRES
jgi:hypothetical protein